MHRPIAYLRRLCRVAAGDDGAAAVSFILVFPIFMLVVAIIVQMALITTAKITVTHAADTAARAAMTSLPAGEPQRVSQAAWLALTPISPKAPSTSSEAGDVVSALQQTGTDVADSFAERYTYAMEATDVRWSPNDDFVGSQGRPVDVTVSYRFRLTVPFAMRVLRADDTSIAGVKGRFWTVSAQSRVQAAHGREAEIDREFWSR